MSEKRFQIITSTASKLSSHQHDARLFSKAESLVEGLQEALARGDQMNDDSYAGISENEAINRALGMRDDDCTCVSSEQAGVGGVEYWRIGIQSNDDPDGEIYYYLVNSNGCNPE